MPTYRFFDKERGDWTCPWCQRWMAAARSGREQDRRQRAHEKSNTCMAARARVEAEARGLTCCRFRRFSVAVAELIGLAAEMVFDTYDNRGWGNIKKGTSPYLPTWFVTICEEPSNLYTRHDIDRSDPDDPPIELHQRFEIVAAWYADLLKPALTDTTYREALEATVRVGGPQAVLAEIHRQRKAKHHDQRTDHPAQGHAV